jgi:rhamnosyltransferase
VSGIVTVAIPTLNAGPEWSSTLAAVRAQQIDRAVELVVCDSASDDDTVAIARSFDAEIIQIRREEFSHGATRNLLIAGAQGDHVAFLTQDAVPADVQWLARLVAAFELDADVGLAFGPYRPRPDASLSVSRELSAWFASFSDGAPRIDALPVGHRDAPPRRFLGHLGFFTDANGCVARRAWEQVPFRAVAYAEDHLLAQDMLRAGFAKVFVPDAAVIHSHEYTSWQWLRRSFDEARAVREVYNWSPDLREVARNLRGSVSGDWRAGMPATRSRLALPELTALAASLRHHGARATGQLLGAHSQRLPRGLVRGLSLEGRP